jgi:2-keto-4-pentenoate hydratase/2-oxohepta-3-ene-1,7-dioic acid hydratase in catechol pathway
MKLVTYRGDFGPRAGVLDPAAGTVTDAGAALGEPAGVAVADLIARWGDVAAPLAAAARAAAAAGGGAPGPGPLPLPLPLPLPDVTLLAPIPEPARNVMCVGKNYRDHSAEFARSGFDASGGASGDTSGPGGAPDSPSRPVIFTKSAGSVIGPGDAIDPHTDLTSGLDYEAELAVIIGPGDSASPGASGIRGISAERAWAHVWGYTIINDVTARDLQRDHKQWFLGKSLDTFCPMGPWAVTADEVDATSLSVRCWVNGELRQKASTRDLIFGIPELIATLSAGITLHPGDIIATGTPAGVGIGFTPPRFLVPGDEVTVEIEGLGTLTNPVGGARPVGGASAAATARNEGA